MDHNTFHRLSATLARIRTRTFVEQFALNDQPAEKTTIKQNKYNVIRK